MKIFIKQIVYALIITLGVTFPVFANEEMAPTENVKNKDPYENFNRPMFYFNDWFDKLVLKPVATVYLKIVPKPISKGIGHIFDNIDTVPTILNDVLQFNLYQATSDTWRLAINTTLGIGGFFDVATEIGLEPNKEDFGLTLARWGWEDSNYLVLPFLGAGTVRDQLAWPINYQYMTIYPYINPTSVRYDIYIAGLIVKRAEFLHYENVLEEAALDRYVFVRDAYLQRRTYLIERNKQLDNPYLENSKPE